MIKASAYYPNPENCAFDFDYYCKSHIPMVRDRLGSACKGIAVDRGTAGGEPGSRAPFVAVAHLYFDSIESFRNAFAPHAKAIMGDAPNYTNVQPAIQISEVLINAAHGETADLHIHRG